MEMSEEPKPVRCGCGGEAKIRQKYLMGNLPDVYVICENCSIRTKEYYSEAEAVIAWNNAMSGISQYFCINTNDYTITNTIDPVEDFHPIYDCMVGKERMAKVIEHDASITVNGYKYHRSEYLCSACKKKVIGGDEYCSHCGARLEWK